MENLLTGTQGVAHLAQLVLAAELHRHAQVALAEAHQSGADLVAGFGNAPDDLGRYQHHDQGCDHHHRNNDNDADGGRSVLLLNDLLLSALELGSQIVTGRGGGSQLGRTLIHDHGNGTLAVCTGYLNDILGLFAPLRHGIDEGIELGLVIHGEAFIKLRNGCLQGSHLGLGSIQVAHIAGEDSVPQVPGGDIVVDAALGSPLVGLYVVVDDVLIGALLGIHHHQGGDNDRQRNQDCSAESHDQAFLDGHVLEIHDAFSS